MALEFSDLTATLRRCNRQNSGCLGGQKSCPARSQRGRSCKGCHLWLRDSWTSASHATRLAASRQVELITAQHSEPGAAVRSPTRDHPTSLPAHEVACFQPGNPCQHGWSLVLGGCESCEVHLSGCYPNLQSPRKGARDHGKAAGTACFGSLSLLWRIEGLCCGAFAQRVQAALAAAMEEKQREALEAAAR